MNATTDIPQMVSSLTLEDKLSLLAGKNFWETQEIPRVGVPSLKMSDGPNGARGGAFSGGTTAACFPACVSLAATWDVSLARRIGKALAEETLSKGGRNFESFSEDPFLTGRLAGQYIQGLQENGVGATIKHFAVNEQETNRFTTNAIVSEKALREIYLKPFEIAIKEGKPWALMTSYNLVNGVHSDLNEYLLKEVLRGDWAWDGLVMSDWGGTNSVAESLNAGLALEMPGPARQFTSGAVKAAIRAGDVTEETVNMRVKEILTLMAAVENLAQSEKQEEKAVINPEHSRLIREVGATGIVLLKNESGILPLNTENHQKIAVLGLAKQCLAHGGGSASVNAHYKVTPFEALEAAFGKRAELLYAEGARLHRILPPIASGLVDLEGRPGLTLTKYSPDDLSIVWSGNISSSYFVTLEDRYGGVTLEGTYSPSVSGNYHLELSSLGPARLSINDREILSIDRDGPDPMAFLLGGASGDMLRFEFEKGKAYKIRVDSKVPQGREDTFALLTDIVGVTLGLMTQQELEEDVLEAAVNAARSAETALIFVGNTNAWETEGRDMESMSLPANGSQDRLIDAVADMNPNTVVINSTGVAIAMPWLDKVKAVVQTWFPGQEAGHSIVDVLTGATNPSGRLPITIPRSLQDTPAFGNFPGDTEKLEVNYAEGSFIGYRHYDHHPEAVLFPFGYGLSYTQCEVDDIRLAWDNTETPLHTSSNFTVFAEVTNSGEITGSEVLQVYVTPPILSSGSKTQRKLVGFARAVLQAKETTTVKIAFTLDTFAEFEESKRRWLVAAGEYVVEIATSAAKKDVSGSSTFNINDDFWFSP